MYEISFQWMMYSSTINSRSLMIRQLRTGKNKIINVVIRVTDHFPIRDNVNIKIRMVII